MIFSQLLPLPEAKIAIFFIVVVELRGKITKNIYSDEAIWQDSLQTGASFSTNRDDIAIYYHLTTAQAAMKLLLSEIYRAYGANEADGANRTRLLMSEKFTVFGVHFGRRSKIFLPRPEIREF